MIALKPQPYSINWFRFEYEPEPCPIVAIGVDPAFRKRGFTMCLLDKCFEIGFIQFEKPLDFIGWVLHEMPKGCTVAIENSNLQNVTFDMSGNKATVAKRSRDAGKNMALSQFAHDLFVQHAKKVYNISPQRKGAKWKEDSIMKGIAKQKGWKLFKTRFNQDERDAFKMLLFC